MYYWRAAQQGDERAKSRIQAIQTAAAGGSLAKAEALKGSGAKKGLFGRLGL